MAKAKQGDGNMHGRVIATLAVAAAIIALTNGCRPEPEPSGAPGLHKSVTGCDELLQGNIDRTVRAADTAEANRVIRAIQADRPNKCAEHEWNPVVADTQHCHAQVGNRLWGTKIPTTLIEAMRRDSDGYTRDEEGNIMIAFLKDARPSNSGVCWMYRGGGIDLWTWSHRTPEEEYGK